MLGKSNTVALFGTTFADAAVSQNLANWIIDTGDTNLQVDGITRTGDNGVTIDYVLVNAGQGTGTGTITIQAKAAAVVAGVDTNVTSVVITEPTIVGYYLDNDGTDTALVTTATVANGTDEATAKAGLSTAGYAKVSDGTYEAITIAWAFDAAYDGTVAGAKAITGTVSPANLPVSTIATTDRTGTVTVEDIVNAEAPTITSDLTDETISVGTVVTLDATATVGDGGTISYEWYSADDEVKTNPQVIVGETTATYAPVVDVAGTFCYYCVVTNTIADNGDGGTKTATTTSAVSTVTVN